MAASAGIIGDASSPIKSAGFFLEDEAGRLQRCWRACARARRAQLEQG